ncbi:hypothetical protein GJ744_002232 [Endocarpon pusillum]|uniref:Uncharacterized protein n=1 Tax=Endocarpon pusillum TaxID=364733 RepID=A0A8H7A935_9EURO|nr:hypothetical protein GJ744_002232 [Endocarpon pusillum]
MAGKNPQRHIGPWKISAKGHLHIDANGDKQTDLTRWRLDITGDRQERRCWESNTDCEQWPPQNHAEKHHLGLDERFTRRHIEYSVVKTTWLLQSSHVLK